MPSKLSYKDKVTILNYLDENARHMEAGYLSDMVTQIKGFYPQYDECDIAMLVMKWRNLQDTTVDNDVLRWYVDKHVRNGLQKLGKLREKEDED